MDWKSTSVPFMNMLLSLCEIAECSKRHPIYTSVDASDECHGLQLVLELHQTNNLSS